MLISIVSIVASNILSIKNDRETIKKQPSKKYRIKKVLTSILLEATINHKSLLLLNFGSITREGRTLNKCVHPRIPLMHPSTVLAVPERPTKTSKSTRATTIVP